MFYEYLKRKLIHLFIFIFPTINCYYPFSLSLVDCLTRFPLYHWIFRKHDLFRLLPTLIILLRPGFSPVGSWNIFQDKKPDNDLWVQALRPLIIVKSIINLSFIMEKKPSFGCKLVQIDKAQNKKVPQFPDVSVHRLQWEALLYKPYINFMAPQQLQDHFFRIVVSGHHSLIRARLIYDSIEL